ncbi:hypothetical protein K2173_011444 [Erythroxylum novogranatense]|uniref:Pre-mRNA-splicing factor SLU7 n=1 Tax=Erythroxylum novogranatense TaxID=1862640 RepID=A0AAV8TG89_9ROSI|nr:hypothetical protein K2173_011444 [Erythroxylum novogranatense]
MATASVAFKSREDHRKQLELEEAGLAPAEVDEDGKEINSHILQYMSSAPWYLYAEKPSLKHQRKWKSDPKCTKSWYDRSAKVCQADKYKKGAWAMKRDAKSCTERPCKIGAKWTNMHIAPDEKIETWNGYDASLYACVIDRYEARDEVTDGEDDEDAFKVDEARVDESKQMDFAKVEMCVRTTGGGSALELLDTAKYLLNFDVNSAYYDPKTRSMREDPLPNADPNEKFYGGDNQYRVSGQALEFKQLNIHAWEAIEKGQDIHMQAAPSKAELLFRNYKVIKEKLKSKLRDTILEKYGNAASEEDLPRELLLGQTLRILLKLKTTRANIFRCSYLIPKSKYEEDIWINNHTSVWGSWWKDHQWGYKCCKQTIRNSYCTGSAGIEAAEAAVDLMKANTARKATSDEMPAPVEEKVLAIW